MLRPHEFFFYSGEDVDGHVQGVRLKVDKGKKCAVIKSRAGANPFFHLWVLFLWGAGIPHGTWHMPSTFTWYFLLLLLLSSKTLPKPESRSVSVWA